MPSGYQALRSGAAWLDLSARGKIYVTGEDRARLLHAMTTNHIQQLNPGEHCYAFFLNAQGRILADAHILCLPDRFLLDTEPETRASLFQHLDKYIIADDVTLEDVTDRLSTISVEGPQAEALLPPMEHARISSTGQPGFRIFTPAKADLVRQLEAAGAVAASAQEARLVRLENGVPRYGEDIFENTLPQETQLHHALHFQKGCYLGQEIVERIRSRGHVNRLLVSLTIEAQEPPEKGTSLTADGKPVGEITSAAFSPALGKVVALAYVRVPHNKPGTPLAAGASSASVRG